MSEKPKKEYIKYTPEQQAAVPTPAQTESEGNGVARKLGEGAAIGAVAGRILGVGAAAGAVVGGTAGMVKGARDEK